MSRTILYIYVMTNDTGFAPCIDNGLFTLACCKGGKKGMRKSAAKEVLFGNNVYVLGLCGKQLAEREYKKNYSAIYLVKIDKIIPMADYYKNGGLSEDRRDNAYKLTSGSLQHKGSIYPHWDSENSQRIDIEGEYVLFSEHFTYWGDKCDEADLESEDALKPLLNNIRGLKSLRNCKICEDFSEFENLVDVRKWCDSAKVIGSPISLIEINDENDDNGEIVISCKTC